MNEEDPKKMEMLFIGIISMFSDGVMQHLGKIANPMTGKIEKNLEAAKATIELLHMLKVKTKGNLSPDEEKYFNALLTNLQLNYVEEVEAPKKENPS